MKLFVKSALISCAVLLAPFFTATADEVIKEPPSVEWLAGFGVSYPLVASFSTGAIVPLTEPESDARFGFPGVPAFYGNIDLGIGGGMASMGLSFPSGTGYSTSAISVKGAVLRTWLVDVGVRRNRTFVGGLTELLISSDPGGKLGIGYFRENRQAGASNNHFVFVYFGVGL